MPHIAVGWPSVRWQKWRNRAGQGSPIGIDQAFYSTPSLFEVPLKRKATFSTSVDTKCAHVCHCCPHEDTSSSRIGLLRHPSALPSPDLAN